MSSTSPNHPLLVPWIIFYSFLRKLYLQRGLIGNFVVRDLRTRYIGSFMGVFWSVIHPVVLLVSYSFVFLGIFRQSLPPEAGTTSFPLFLFCGILPWLFFQDSVQRACTSVIDNSNLITKTIFPSEILPLTVVLSALVNHLVGFVILLAALLFIVGKVSLYILFTPLYLLCLILFTLGFAWLVASLNVFVRDVSQVLSVILIFWFWFTPIFFPPERCPAWLTPMLRVNPLAYVVIGYRDCILRTRMPDWRAIVILATSSVAVFVIGGLFFRYTKREFVDVL